MKKYFEICENVSEENGVLTFAGLRTDELAKKYKTPLYLFDENRIRKLCKIYYNSAKKAFGDKFHILYASKAASFKRIYEIVNEEGLGVDVVSPGEIYTAYKAGFPMEKAYFHSNNKSDEDIEFAMNCGVGYFVVDNTEEADAINEYAGKKGITQNVLLRLTPGIDPHTFEAVATGKVDSKFGFAIETGQADDIIKHTLTLKNIKIVGFHSHVGSQVFDSDVFYRSAKVMLDYIKYAKETFNLSVTKLDLGGGYGVKYTENDPEIDIGENIISVGEYVHNYCREINIDVPEIGFEPGRSIVADAGMTLYTVGSVKDIKGYKTYVSVDGGMTDNIRYALYDAEYTLVAAENATADRDMICDVVGKCCECGDIIQTKVKLPKSIKRGDYLACLTTGAYNYSMASNYNRIPRPPIVMIKDKESYVAVERETNEDLIKLDK